MGGSCWSEQGRGRAERQGSGSGCLLLLSPASRYSSEKGE